MNDDDKPTREPTVGENLAGVDFNPSGNAVVAHIKRKAADFIDAVSAIPGATPTAEHMAQVAIDRAVDAQMWAVKAATRRH